MIQTCLQSAPTGVRSRDGTDDSRTRSFVFAISLISAIAILAFSGAVGTCQLASLSVAASGPSADTLEGLQSASNAPVSSQTALANARAAIARKEFPHAEQIVHSYLATRQDSAEGHFLLGYILNAEHHPKRSLAEYTTGARFHPPSADDLIVVATDYIYLQDYVDADKWLSIATQWKPDDALAWYFLGRTKYNENRFQEAADAFGRCLHLEPRNVRAENNLGLSYEGLGDDKEADRAYLTSIRWQVGSEHPYPQPYLNLGMLLAREGDAAQAIPYLQTAVKLAPHNPKAHEQLGRTYEKMHMLGSAQSELKKAIDIAPNVSALHFQLGRIYHQEKKDELARKEFARCAVLNGVHSTDADETPNPDSPN